jgi:hypothetical protein
MRRRIWKGAHLQYNGWMTSKRRILRQNLAVGGGKPFGGGGGVGGELLREEKSWGAGGE